MNQLNAKKPCGVWGLVTGAAAVIAVLALLFLVPTSPALLVDEPVKLFTLVSPQTLEAVSYGEMDIYFDPVGPAVTAYAVCIAAGAALAIILTALLAKLRGRCAVNGAALALVSGAFGLVCSHLLFCAVRWSYIVNDLGSTAAFLGQFWQGGYTMYGAILGGLLGALLYAKARRQKVTEALELIVPGMLLLIACGRFGEQFTLQGVGSYRAAEALQGLPFTGLGEWGDPFLKVYAYETLIAAVAFIAALVLVLCRAPWGRAAETGLAIVSVCQIMFESWRGDELIKFGFVCLNMLMAAAVLVFILATRIVRGVKQQGWKLWSILRIVLFVLGAGLVIFLEFGLDGKMGITISNTILYGVQAVAIAMMGAAVIVQDGRTGRAGQ